jgi:hypothetical protein
MRPDAALRSIKLLHTTVWLLFALGIMAIPVLGYVGRFRLAAWLVGIVLLEVLVLAFNGRRCPLTDIAARYTEDRRANFDIYLPEWIARHNKSIFGILFALGSLFALARWVARIG